MKRMRKITIIDIIAPIEYEIDLAFAAAAAHSPESVLGIGGVVPAMRLARAVIKA